MIATSIPTLMYIYIRNKSIMHFEFSPLVLYKRLRVAMIDIGTPTVFHTMMNGPLLKEKTNTGINVS